MFKSEKKRIQTSFGKIDVKKIDAMILSHRELTISHVLQELICKLGFKLPFEKAASELSLLLRIDINAKQVQRFCQYYGQELDNIDWSE